jgi:hypothetical protein
MGTRYLTREPTEIDRRLMDPAGEAAARDALRDFFLWAPESFVDHILGDLMRGSWILDELVREVGREHGYHLDSGVLTGCGRRVTRDRLGCHHDDVPGLRVFLRSEDETCVLSAHRNPFHRPGRWAQ